MPSQLDLILAFSRSGKKLTLSTFIRPVNVKMTILFFGRAASQCLWSICTVVYAASMFPPSRFLFMRIFNSVQSITAPRCQILLGSICKLYNCPYCWTVSRSSFKTFIWLFLLKLSWGKSFSPTTLKIITMTILLQRYRC